MRITRRLFATLLVLNLLPLLLLALVHYWSALRSAESTIEQNQEHDLTSFCERVNNLLGQSSKEIESLTYSAALRAQAESHQETPVVLPVSNSTANGSEIPTQLRTEVASVMNRWPRIPALVLYDNRGHPLMAVSNSGATGELTFQTKDFLPTIPKPDERALTGARLAAVNSAASVGPNGAVTTFTSPIISDGNKLVGSLVAQVLLNPIFSTAANEVSERGAETNEIWLVMDRTYRILYHPNDAVKNQPVNTAMPSFQPIANEMMVKDAGHSVFKGQNNAAQAVTYRRLPALDVFASRVTNRDAALIRVKRTGLLIVALAGVVGLLTTGGLVFLWQNKAAGLERVTAGVEAIAKGELDHRIELRSRDDLKPLADNVDLLKKQLRDQIAREAETQQFQSFVRLSAILTHDLKNAIEALSLTVANMSRHFENAEFRADAMKTLHGATENLRATVARLSNPVTTLSGEHKIPQSIDLVPILRRVVARTAVEAKHTVTLNLPDYLYALIDIERIDKVIENLVINAHEAIVGDGGTITIEAGVNAQQKPFFTVTDNGVGMSPQFIEDRLYRPFATTKKRGVGLGLYTCREVVRAHGGSIEVQSRQGAGTTFTVVLPSPPTGRNSLGSGTHRLS